MKALLERGLAGWTRRICASVAVVLDSIIQSSNHVMGSTRAPIRGRIAMADSDRGRGCDDVMLISCFTPVLPMLYATHNALSSNIRNTVIPCYTHPCLC